MKDQPKPTTDSVAFGPKGLTGINQPTGEWTEESVRLLAVVNTKGAERIANAHNSELEAEQQKRADWNVVIEDLEKALAAEREESAKWRSEAHKTNELRQQLAAKENEQLQQLLAATYWELRCREARLNQNTGLDWIGRGDQ